MPVRYKQATPPGQLITDHYAYNDEFLATQWELNTVGTHWVGDLAVEADIDVTSSAGTIAFELVEGKAKFRCIFDIAAGKGSFETATSDDTTTLTLTDETQFDASLTGEHKVLFANADDKLFLWIDDRFVASCHFQRTGDVVPFWSIEDPGDAEPIGIAGKQVAMKVDRLRVLRDIYYVSKNSSNPRTAEMPDGKMEYLGGPSPRVIRAILSQPKTWDSDAAGRLFKMRDRDESFVFHLEDTHLLPMGDNSPSSNDARTWDGPRYIDRSFLLGQAFFIHWPHAKTSPLPFWPNFGRMRLIR